MLNLLSRMNNRICEMPKSRKQQDGGFTLIELAIVMTIIGLILAGFIKAYNLYKKNQIRIEQDKVMEKVHSALADYIRRNGEYPCPADPARRPGEQEYGLESKGGGACTITGSIRQFNGWNGGTVAIGSLPVSSLKLPYYLIADAYGNKFTYAISETVVNDATFDANGGQIRIFDSSTSGVPIDDDFHFVIVSHGPDGKGATTRYGSENAFTCSGAAIDVENCDYKLAGVTPTDATTFIDVQYAEFNQGTEANHFDDMLSYSLARKESTLWFMTTGGNGELNISNRNLDQNVGIGTPNPTEKLHVTDGDIRSEQNVIANQNVQANQNVIADQEVEAGTAVRSPVYFYK